MVQHQKRLPCGFIVGVAHIFLWRSEIRKATGRISPAAFLSAIHILQFFLLWGAKVKVCGGLSAPIDYLEIYFAGIVIGTSAV